MVIRVVVTVAAALGIPAPSALAQELRVYTLAGGGSQYDIRDGMRATSAALTPADAAVRPDGTLLVSSDSVVWKLNGRGRLIRVMGRRGTGQSRGDGGPALEATLPGGVGMATEADGGLLIAEGSGGCVIRRVDPDGTVARVAGRRPADVLRPCWATGAPPVEIGDGGPALDALLGAPGSVAALPDGGFLVADNALNRVRRVAPDGTITTVAGRHDPTFMATPPYSGQATSTTLASPRDVAALPDGGFLFADQNGIHEVDAGGSIRTVQLAAAPGTTGLSELALGEAGLAVGFLRRYQSESAASLFRIFGGGLDLTVGSPPGFFAGDGDRLADARIDSPVLDVEPLPDGGLLIVGGSSVRAALRDGSPRLAVAIARESVRSLAHRRLAVRLTRRAELTVELRGRGKLVRRFGARGGPGLAFARVPSAVRPDLYDVRVFANTADHATASSRLRMIVGRGLPLRAARLAAVDLYWESWARAADEYPYPAVRRCRRFSRTRVDCVVGEAGGYDDSYCIWIGAVTRGHDGVVYKRPYACPKRGRKAFKRNPRWRLERRPAQPF
jgi:hypothetical protein